MEILNLSIEFHIPDGNTLKKMVRVDNTTKIGEMSRLLLDKFGRSDFEPAQFQLITPQKGATISFHVLSDLNKSLSSYNIKNNDELIFKKRQKKSNPSNAKLASKKKPESIFKTLFSMSTLEMKLGEDKSAPEISEVENQIDDLGVLFKALEILTNSFNQNKDIEDIISSFQYVGNESDIADLIRIVLSNNDGINSNNNSNNSNNNNNNNNSSSNIGMLNSGGSGSNLGVTTGNGGSGGFNGYGSNGSYYNNNNINNNIELTATQKNPKVLCSFLLHLLQIIFSQTSLTYSLYTTYLKINNNSSPSNTDLSRSTYFYDIPVKSRIILKHIMLFLYNLTQRDASLLDSLSNIIGPFILGNVLLDPPPAPPSSNNNTSPPISKSTSNINLNVSNASQNNLSNSGNGDESPDFQSQNLVKSYNRENSGNSLNSMLHPTSLPNTSNNSQAPPLIQVRQASTDFTTTTTSTSSGNLRSLSNTENSLCKKVAVDLIQNIPLYLLFSHLKIQQLEGEKILFSAENIFCVDKCNFPPSKAMLGEIWVTNFRIIFINSNSNSSTIPNSTSSNSISSFASTQNLSILSIMTLFGSYNGNGSSGVTNATLSGGGSTSSSSNQNTPITTSPIHTSTSSTGILNPIGGSLTTSSSNNSNINNLVNNNNNNFSNNNNNNNSNINKLSTLDNTEIPLSMIYRWKMVKTGSLYDSFKIYCKDFRCKIIGFQINSHVLLKFKDLLTKCSVPTLDTIFAYNSKESSFSNTECFPDHSLLQEYNRIGVSWDLWRTTTQSKLCEHYPPTSVVPKSVNDNIVVTSAYYRSYGFPVLAWSHPTQKSSITRATSPEDQNHNSSNYLLTPNSPNSSSTSNLGNGSSTGGRSTTIDNGQTSISRNSGGSISTTPSIQSPTPNLPPSQHSSSLLMSPQSSSPRMHQSISSSNIPQVCQEDIDFLRGILDIKSSSMLNVFDTGSGGSYSSTMIGCQIEFLNLPPPNKVRERFNRLLHLHLGNPDSEWSETIRFFWLDPLKPILSAAINIAMHVDQGRSVLIQNSSSGPDIELQLSSLAQILLDPYYRTLDGFRVLMEKEWLSYGYPFSKRCHHKTSDDGFSPIFMQFIFLVWQIWKEFPTHFQFNEYYLLTLLDYVYNSRFGTFLCNNYKERMENNVYSSTKSFWSFQQQNQSRFTNLFYRPSGNVGNGNSSSVQHLKCLRVFQDTMWNEYFFRYCFKSSLAIEQFEDRIKVALLDIEMTVNSAITSTANALLPFLETLDLSNLRLYYLPSESTLYHLVGLRELNLSKNNLNSISCSLSSLVKLEKLSFEENSITNLPIETVVLLAEKLTSLTELNLSSNQLIDLPIEFSMFSKSLKKLHLKNNRFSAIPEVLGMLENLIELDLSELDLSSSTNSGVSIPTKLSKLCVLNLNQTRIVELPKEFGDLKSLEKLYLDFNSLVTLPHSFRLLKNLEELSLSFNSMTELPREVCFLVNLKKLMIEGNQIQFLPNEISQLSKLMVLNVCKNKLDSLPASIGQLSQLVSLNLNNNSQLVSLRPTMGLLSNLTELKLEGTRLKTPPPEIVSLGLKSILLYLKDLIKGQEQCYKMKLMIVGQENVGKTTLLKTLKEKKKKATPGGPNISTDGIAIDQWVFSCLFEELDETSQNGRMIKKKQDITLSIWDFAGQEIYYTTHQFFLSERSVYIVAWNCALAEEESRVEFWLQSITTRAKDAPIIIVGTHLDDVNRTTAKMQKKRMKEKYLTRYQNIKAIKLVSCTSGKGITSLREKLEALVQSQSNMGESLPRSYMLLENLVKEETKKRIIPTIPWTEFIQMGTICTITDEAELLRATMFLHQLGSLVYFPKEPGLKQFVILDPQWITTMLSSIITTKHSYAKDGILNHKSLKQIWRPPQYPTNLHPHLISLLEKFEISYNLSPDSTSFETGTSLIPSLLLNDRPAIFPSLWGPFNQSIRQFGRVYQFEFVPNGFFSRLMVRILNFARVEAKCYWKNGMILQHDEETIFLEMNNAKKSLSFTVRGGANSTTLSRDVIETIQSLLDDSFQLPTYVFVPCFHCIFLSLPQCYYFPLDVCENAAVKGTGYLKCLTYDANVRTDLLVPDLVMSNFTGAKIPFDQLMIEEMIGEGGAALVYRARWQGQTVAVKKLKTIENLDGPVEINDISLSKAFNEFRRECWVMSELEHPNIVQLKGLCLDPLCIVTEYLPHGNLYSFLHKPEMEFSWLFRLKVALDISSGMAFLHSSTPPIIHRDLKSPNILLASINENAQTIAKVVDFGLSGLQHTITNRGVENPLWLAPEILNKTKEASTQTDVYAFGVILWELVTRKDYFGDIGFMTLIEEKVISGERPKIPEDCPEMYAKLIVECWQNDASQRPKFSEIEDRLIKIAEAMFPDIHLSNICQQQQSSPSKSSSTSPLIKPLNLSAVNELGESSNQTPKHITTTTTTTTTSDHKRQLSTDSSSSYRNNKSSHDTISHSTSVASDLLDIDNTLTVATTPRNRSKTNDENINTSNGRVINNSINNNDQPLSPNSQSYQPIQHTQSQQQLDNIGLSALLDALPNSPTVSSTAPSTTPTNKKVMYTSIVGDSARTRRGSVSIQPFQNEFNRELLPNQGTIQCLVKVGNGYQVWAGTGNGFISTWKIEGQEKYIQRLFEANKDKKRIHCLYPYMNTVWCGSADDTVTIWDIDTYQKIKSYSVEGPSCITRVGNTMWVGTIVNTIHIYDLKKKTKYKGKISLDSPIECLLRRDQEVWVATLGNIARVDVNSLRVVQMIKAHDKAIHAMIQVDDHVWTASSDGTIKVWSSTCQSVHTIENAHSSRIFTLELVGDFVWSGSWDTTIKIWSTKDYHLVSENSGKHKDAISSFVYISNDQPLQTNERPIQKQVWSGSWDSSICVWALPNDTISRSNTIFSSDSQFNLNSSSSNNSNSITNSNSNNNLNGNNNINNSSSNNNNTNNNAVNSPNQTSQSAGQLGTIHEQTSPNSATPLSCTPPGSKGLMQRRTVSFMNVLERFSNDKTKK
ncbi:hypothetical protein RB653_007210 [Dictyostelium firmibasis]|uniref:non-specific serine/threonine protein kinase n=1 Tax=Dictyostelium firmibasis TaxID=79012 RepID=A0AAN7TU65_9MYCE